jgi:hypothetical protein
MGRLAVCFVLHGRNVGRAGAKGNSGNFFKALYMKTLLSVAALVVLAGSSAMAADGRVSHQSLSKMGLSGMQVMSDAQGMAVRGQFAIASGTSFAIQFGGGGVAGSVNTSTGVGNKSASQSNFSVAGQTEIVSVGYFSASVTHVIGAGGASSAKSN